MDDQQTPVTPTPTPIQPIEPVPVAQQTVVVSAPKKNGLVVGIIVAAVVLVGAGLGLYWYMTNTPDAMLQQAAANLNRDNTLAAKFKVTTGVGASAKDFNGDLAVQADAANSKNGEVILGLGDSSKRVGITMRVLDGSLYFRATSLSNLGALLDEMAPRPGVKYDTPSLKTSLAKLDGQWYSITKDELKTLSEQAGSDQIDDATTPEDVKKVYEIYARHAFIQADKIYADEAVDGVNSAHFSIKIDKPTYVAFLQELKTANLKSIKVSDQDIDKAKADDMTLKEGAIELWIARDSKKLKQVRIASTKKDEEFALVMTMTGLPTFEKLEKPAGVKPVKELMTTLLGPSASTLYSDDYSY